MVATPSNPEMVIVTINIPVKLNKFIQKLKHWGLIPSRSEVLRHACIKYCLELCSLMKHMDEDLGEDMEKFDPDKFIKVPNGDGTYNMHEILRRLE